MFAIHPSSTANLVVNVGGFVVDNPMTYKATKDRHELFIEIEDDLDGLDVTVSDDSGDCDTTPIH